jgi:hypothetical protein
MGLMLIPEFQKEVPRLTVNSTGEFLIRVVELLDAIAEERSLTPLGSFDRYSGYTDYAEELALSGGNPADAELRSHDIIREICSDECTTTMFSPRAEPRPRCVGAANRK